MRKNNKIPSIYLLGSSFVFLFAIVVIGVCVFFYQKGEKEISKDTTLNTNHLTQQEEKRLNLNYIGLENIPFLKIKQEIFMEKYESYISDELNLPKVTTSIFFSNFKQMSNNTYVVYSQIDDTKSTILQTIVNIKEYTYDFSKCEQKIEDIEELGGVLPGGNETLADKYKTKAVEIQYAQVQWGDETIEEEAKKNLQNTMQRYAYEKYKNTDIQVTLIKFRRLRKENEYTIYEFQMDDLTATTVAVYWKNNDLCFTMEV